MSVSRLLCLYLLLVPCQTTHGQTDSSAVSPLNLETYYQESLSAEQNTALLDWLAERAAAPLPINIASASELEQLPMLPAPLARRIVRYRTEHGPFRSLDDLQAVAGITPSLLDAVRPFVTTVSPPAHPLHIEWLQRIDPAVDQDPDYASGRFAGSPLKLYSRLRIRRAKHFQLGVAADKDAGEPFSWDPASQTFLYDHVAGHLAFSNVGLLEQLIIGDYTAGFGQGLTLQRRTVFRSAHHPVRALQSAGTGIRPFASRSEYGFFRGAALSLATGTSWRVRAFASQRHLDGAPGDSASHPGIRRIVTSGYHRTAAERARKGVLTETLAGTSIAYLFPSATIGVTTYHARFDPALIRDRSPHRYFAQTGSHVTAAGLHGDASLGAVELFGEASMGTGRSPNGVFGLVYRAARAVTLGFHLRHYAPDGPALHGAAFGTSGTPANESGIYSAIELQPKARWNLTAFFDQYTHPWLRGTAPRPTTGFDAGITLTHEPRPWLHYYLQFRQRAREEGYTTMRLQNRAVPAVTPALRRTLRLHVEYAFSTQLRLRTRLEGTWAAADAPGTDRGMLLYQDLRWQARLPVEAAIRLTFFDTESWAARVYAFENDVRYGFSVPALSGSGQRAYLLLRWRPLDTLFIEGRYGFVDYVGAPQQTRPAAPFQRDLHLQAQYAF